MDKVVLYWRQQRVVDPGRYAKHRAAWLTTVALGIFALAPGTAAACSCVAVTLPLENAVKDSADFSSVVFSAEVVSVTAGSTLADDQTAVLRVLKVWKGSLVVGQLVRTATNTSCCACGRAVVARQRLVLFLRGEEPYALSVCGLSGLLESSEEVVAILDALY